MSKNIDILELFFDTENEFHVREVARLLNIHPTTASTALEQLAKQRFLIKKKAYHHIFYTGNKENPLFLHKKKSYVVEKILASGLISFIDNELHPDAIVLFGSYAKGDNILGSDIDIFILTESKKLQNYGKFEKILRSKLHIFQYSHEKFNELKRQQPQLVNNVVNGIILFGYIEVIC